MQTCRWIIQQLWYCFLPERLPPAVVGWLCKSYPELPTTTYFPVSFVSKGVSVTCLGQGSLLRMRMKVGYGKAFMRQVSYLMGFPGGASGKEFTCQARRHKRCGSIPGLGWSPGGGHDNPFQYSCWRSPRTQESGGLQSIGSHRVRHDRSNLVSKLSYLFPLFLPCTWFWIYELQKSLYSFKMARTRDKTQYLRISEWTEKTLGSPKIQLSGWTNTSLQLPPDFLSEKANTYGPKIPFWISIPAAQSISKWPIMYQGST